MREHTPADVFVRTPLPAIDRSFDMAVELVDQLRTAAHRAGCPEGYYGVSDGRVNPCPTWDSRDWDHVSKVYAYLWGTEAGLGRSIGANIWDDQLLEGGRLKWCYGRDQRGVHVAHFCKYAADYFAYVGDEELLHERWPALLSFVRWVFAAYDPDGLGLVADASPEAQGAGFLQSFWGYYIGEPEHFPPNLSPRSAPVIATMTFCGLLRRAARFAAQHGLPEAQWLADRWAFVHGVLEDQAYCEQRGYYRIQYDAFNRQWYFSLNGACEESRELLVVPYYADEVAEDAERARVVARYVRWVLQDEAVFPMPVTYPFYRYYGASTQHHYHAFGMDRFLFRGCWDNSYHNSVNLLNSTGLVDPIAPAIVRRSEAACRDGDFIEWYQRDGQIGEAGTALQYHRDRYGVSATAHLASIVEGLFGIRPALPGFAAVRLQPAFPYHRPDRYGGPNLWLERDVEIALTLPGGRRLGYAFRCDAGRRKIHLRCTPTGIPAHVRLPYCGTVDGVRHGEREVPCRTERRMDTDFLSFDVVLDGQPITVSLAPQEVAP